MTITLILEVAISMVFLYLLGSQVVLSIYELWAGYTNSRGKFLYRKLKGTIGIATAQALYNQAPIAALSPASQATPSTQSNIKQKLGVDNSSFWDWWLGFDGLPAYIPTDLFASTLLAMVAPNTTTKADIMKALTAAGTTNPNWLSGEILDLLYKLLAGLSDTADLATCQKSIALWYDAYGERLTGWYKRQVRLWLFFIGLVVAFVGNIDSPFILRYLWAHPQLSSSIADTATRENQSTNGAKLRDADKEATTLQPAKATEGKSAQPTSKADSLKQQSSNRLKIGNDSLQQLLQASEVHIQALNKRLHVLGFPIGRADSVKADSMELLTPFYVRQQTLAIRKGSVLFPDSGRYLRYTRRDTLLAKQKGVYWKKSYLPLKSVTANLLKDGRDRSNPNAGFGPFFGPQSQSAWLTFWGWFLTALALSVGAPFWFDLLCRLVNIRNLGIKPPRTGQ